MIVIGLTGGIASGKSLVARELSKKPGFAAIDIDKVAWEVYHPGSCAYRKVVRHFGEQVLTADGKIDRKRLGEIVFRDAQKLQLLDGIVHPAVTAKLNELVEEHRRQGTRVLILEAALLLESSHVDRPLFDYIVALKVARREQLRRLQERDGLTREEAERRIGSQDRKSLEEANYVIKTRGRPEETVAQAEELFASLMESD